MLAPPAGTVEAALARGETLLATRPELAERQATTVLQAAPGHPQALLLLGQARRAQGDLQGARDILEPLAQAQLRAAAVQFEWAQLQIALGEAAGAVASLRRVVALRPQFDEAWHALGDAAILAGDAPAADRAYAQAMRSALSDPALLAAADALAGGDVPGAERQLREHLKSHPNDVAAIRMLGEIGIRLGRYQDAESLLARCLELAPGFTAARHNYAVALFRQGRAHAAIPHIEKLLSINARDPNYRTLMAGCLATIGDYAGAIAIYEKLVAEYPKQPKTWLGYGHALKTAGRTADAVRAYRSAIKLAPKFGEAYWSLANLKTEVFLPAEIAAMRKHLEQPDLGAEDKFHLQYALGRALEQAGDYAGSFKRYAAGAAQRRRLIAYNAEHTTEQMRRSCAIATAEFFKRRQGGCPDPAPIFVVGLPRSGSTLIEQILASHSEVEGTMELSAIADIVQSLRRDGTYPKILAELTPERRLELGKDYLARAQPYRKRATPYFVDKMPNNFAHIALIQLILPRAKIVDARRGAMAACFSAFKQHFARGQNFSYDLRELGHYYRDYVTLMTHFDAVLPKRIHRVLYEDMVEHTEEETRKLLHYCTLQFEPGCLKFFDNDRAVRTASSEQVRKPIFRDGLEQWRNYEPWLGPLAEALEEGRPGALPLDLAQGVTP